MDVLHQIVRRLQRAPLRTVVVDDFRKWRGLTLYLASLILAGEIEKRTRRERIGLMLPTSGFFPMALLATWLARRTPVPLNYLLKPEELEFVIRDADLDTVITAGPMLERFGDLPAGVEALLIDKMSFRRIPRPRRTPRLEGDHIGVLIYTSGTTGKPKGVPLSAGNLAANVAQCIEWGELRRDDVFLGVLPQFHSFGLTVLTLLPLSSGAKVVYTAQFNTRRLRALMRQHRPTAFVGVPAMFAAFEREREAAPGDFQSLRMTISGGEPLDARVREAFRERFGIPIQQGYGLTETGPVLNWLRPADDRPASVGRALPGVELQIVDSDNRPLAPGEEGEIRVRGANVMTGYFNRPEESAHVFDDEGFFHTGDLGMLDDEGFLYITGRRSDLIIVSGENVFPREIEEVLNDHPSVADSGVIGVVHPSRGQVPVAFVELAEGASLDERALRAHCRQRLATYKVPRQVTAVEKLPRGPTGKVLRRELTAMLSAAPPPGGDDDEPRE